MKIVCQFLYLLAIFLAPLNLFAQNDSIKPNTITSFFTADQFETDSINHISESLQGFQNYLPRTHIGNSGLAIAPNTISPATPQPGFSYSPNHFRHYFYDRNSLLFYHTRSPFSDLRYITGSKQEQSFKMTFSYNVKKNWNISADFFRIRSEGFYLQQGTNDNFIALSTNFRSKKNRYWLLAAGTYNYVQNVENGGIRDDSTFENSGNSDKKLIPVNLAEAKMSLLDQTIFVQQYFNFGKAPNDSAPLIPGSRIILSSSIEDNLFRYKDGDPLGGFYANVYNDSSSSNDSAYHFLLDNKLAWKRTNNHRYRGFVDWFGLGISIDHQYGKIKQWEIDTAFSNITAGAELYNTYSKKSLWYSVRGNYTLDGPNKDDLSISASVKKGLIDSTTSITAFGSSSEKAPEYIYHRYSTNHFRWNNSLEKVGKQQAGIAFVSGKYRLFISASLINYTNPVYFDNFAIARQYSGSVSVITANLKKDFTLFNWHLDNNISYQYVPDSTVIRLPEYILQHSLYYENDVKKVMRLQIGASVYYSAAYYADAYMPATGQFYLQDDKQYGNYPFLDFFVTARVKTLRFFFKVEHLNAGWTKNTYMLTPHYPANGRAFKVGFSWRFFD